MLETELIKSRDFTLPFLDDCSHYLGLSGSSLSGNLLNTNDVDLVLVLPDDFLNNQLIKFPEYLDCTNWEILRTLTNNYNNYVFSLRDPANPKLKIEVYQKSLADKILSFQQVEINRVKEVKQKNKEEFFYNRFGRIIKKPLAEHKRLSSTTSFILENKELYWGMHFERLFLSQAINDSLHLLSKRKLAVKHFLDLIGSCTNLNDLFFCTRTSKFINLEHLMDIR